MIFRPVFKLNANNLRFNFHFIELFLWLMRPFSPSIFVTMFGRNFSQVTFKNTRNDAFFPLYDSFGKSTDLKQNGLDIGSDNVPGGSISRKMDKNVIAYIPDR